MTKSSKEKAVPAGLVECMSSPAVLASLPALRILASNQAMLNSYGASFSEGGELELRGVDLEADAFALRLVASEPRPLFSCEGGDGPFALLRLPGGIILIYEIPSECESVAETCESCGRKIERAFQPFHFSYMESVATGRRCYPHPELLERLRLVEPGAKELPWRSVIEREDLPLYDNAISNVKAHGGNHELSYGVRTLDGDTLRVTDYFALTKPQDGKWPVIVGTIVSRTPPDEDLRAFKRLELQGRLLGGMVHDFKNLLGGIQNIIEWSMTLAEDRPELVDALGKTLAYTSQATKLITGTLRMGSGRRELKTELVSLSQVVQSLEPLIRHSVPSSISLELLLDASTPKVYAQRDILKDIVLNLCMNARDAMCKRGRRLSVSVAPREVADEAGRPQSFACLSVKDDGCGMTQTQLARLFDAFQTSKEHGVGLGLWMVNKSVKSLDGRILVGSEPGDGSVFEVLLPAAKSQLGEVQDEAHEKAGKSPASKLRKFREGAKKTILYVEDDPLIRSSVAAWLDSLGFVIIESDNGRAALDIFKSRSAEIDLVIQDFILPGLRGDELLAGLLAAKAEIPVIVASANPDGEEVSSLKDKGARAFLPKPFLMDELLSILDEIFEA